jgi:uncharacterized OsmC-like protein
MQTVVRLVHKRDMRCEATVGNARVTLRIDSLKNRALGDAGPTPMELLALAHGACTGMLAAMKGAAEGVKVEDMEIEVAHDFDAGPPMRLRSATIRFLVSGDVSPEQAAKMRAGAAMCPVHTGLRTDIPVVFEVVRKA